MSAITDRGAYRRAAPALPMGDLNDEPFDVSVVRHALEHPAARSPRRGRSPFVESDVADRLGPDGSFENRPNMFDRFMVNSNVATDDTGSISILPRCKS